MDLIKKMDDFFDYAGHPISKRHFPGAPWHLMTIGFFYIAFVGFGTKIMRNRKAFDLKGVIRLYNIVNIVFNGIFLVVGLFLTKFLKDCWFCQPTHLSSATIMFVGYSYMYLKVFDLLDTVFFVLRKKNNQVTFLHVSHHAIMPFTAWSAIKYAPMIATGLTPTVNSFIHIVMYTYYYKASQGVQLNWIKRHITRMQLVQFVIISIHAAHLILLQNCDYPKWFAWVELAHGLFFMYTFSKFYRKEYYGKSQSRSDGVYNDKRKTVNEINYCTYK